MDELTPRVSKSAAIEILNVPQSVYSIAQKRMAPFVAHSANLARMGTVDLMGLACSSYLQGAYDSFEGLTRHATVIDEREPID